MTDTMETELDDALSAASEMFGGLIDELVAAGKDLLNTSTNERNDPSVWFPRVDRLRAAMSRAENRHILLKKRFL